MQILNLPNYRGFCIGDRVALIDATDSIGLERYIGAEGIIKDFSQLMLFPGVMYLEIVWDRANNHSKGLLDGSYSPERFKVIKSAQKKLIDRSLIKVGTLLKLISHPSKEYNLGDKCTVIGYPADTPFGDQYVDVKWLATGRETIADIDIFEIALEKCSIASTLNSNPKYINNQGRKTCIVCGAQTKKIQALFGFYDICPICESVK